MFRAPAEAHGEAVLYRLGVVAGRKFVIAPGSAFIYSVYEDRDDGHGYLVYRAALETGTDPAILEIDGARIWVPIEDLAWTGLRPTLAALLRRYARERQSGRFGIYVDSTDGGRVALMQDAPHPWRTAIG